MSNDFQTQKKFVLDFYKELDKSSIQNTAKILEKYTNNDYLFYGMHPFNEQKGSDNVSEIFWKPLKKSFSHMQRRMDVFMAGSNAIDDFSSIWVCSMGHLMGLFDKPWLGILPTKKMAFLRYAEFIQIKNNSITKSAFFCDIISIMRQSGFDPLPLQTGANFITPGPITHDGLLYKKQNAKKSQKTLDVIDKMVDDINNHQKYKSPKQELQNCWHNDMIWYGPSGIGATYTINRYINQHQQPFRTGIKNRKFNGHICKIAEGNYGGFFGFANLSMIPTGGFMGLPSSNKQTQMRVVDIYRRHKNKLAENWVFIDILHYLYLLDLDLLNKMQYLKYKHI